MKREIYTLIILIISFTSPVFSQSDSIDNPNEAIDTLQQDFGLFKNDEILNITLRFDITEYQRKKSKENYLPAILTYHLSKKDSINKEIRIKSGGNMRNEYCSFPPIRLNFKNVEPGKENMQSLGKVKMVTHCTAGNETYLFKEYLIYKLYNVLTEYSFKVRLLRINYINTHKQAKPINTYAFIIEPIEFLARRIDGNPVNSDKVAQANIKPAIMDRMAIFSYMIGNTDWTVPRQHNIKVISLPKSENPGMGVIVPYDFDYSGLVNSSYAIPHENLHLDSVRERYYMGKCRSDSVYLQELKEFSDKKDEFYKVITDFPLLKERTKKEMIDYLAQFYYEIDKSNSIIYSLRKTCID